MLWYYATFGPSGGPPTLSVKRVEEAGATSRRPSTTTARPRRVTGLVFHVGSKRTIKAQPNVDGLPGPASGRARARDRDRRGPLERGEVRLARRPAARARPRRLRRRARARHRDAVGDAATAVRRSSTPARVPAGLTAMQALDRKLEDHDALRRPVRPVDRRRRGLGRRAGATGSTSSTASRATAAPPRCGCGRATSSGGTTARGAAAAMSVPVVVGAYPAAVPARHDERQRRRCRPERRAPIAAQVHGIVAAKRPTRNYIVISRGYPPDTSRSSASGDGALLELGARGRATARCRPDGPRTPLRSRAVSAAPAAALLAALAVAALLVSQHGVGRADLRGAPRRRAARAGEAALAVSDRALTSAALVMLLTPFVEVIGSHPLWTGPTIPVLGTLDVTREELANGIFQGLRLAAVGARLRGLRAAGRPRPAARLGGLGAALDAGGRARDAARAAARARRARPARGAARPRRRARAGARLLSPLLAGSLERGLELAEAMEARGYGRPARTRAPRPAWGMARLRARSSARRRDRRVGALWL